VAGTSDLAAEVLTSKYQLNHRFDCDYVTVYERWPEQENAAMEALMSQIIGFSMIM